jgi:type IX secretion system PorP/SprF family membrane protein
MKIKGYIIVGMLALSAFAVAQQQTLYTNYLLNQYLYNPAYAGVDDGTKFNMGYRNQWAGFDGAPKTFMVSGYGKLKKKPNMALGGIITTERIGLLQRTAFYATYSYHLKINKKAAINFGLGVGGIQHKVRVYDARPYDQDDAFLSSDVLRGLAFDANAGFYFYTKNFFLGFSDQQMPNAKILWDNSKGRNTNHFYAYTGYNFNLNPLWVIQPTILLRSNSPAPYAMEYNARVIYDEMIWAGLSYRHKSSMCFMVGCKIQKQLSFGYSYDLTTSAIQKYSTGSHEIILSYLVPYKKKKSKSDLIKDADEEELNKIDNSLKTNLKNKKKKEEEKANETETPKAEESVPEKTLEPEIKIEDTPKEDVQLENTDVPETTTSNEEVIETEATQTTAEPELESNKESEPEK